MTHQCILETMLVVIEVRQLVLVPTHPDLVGYLGSSAHHPNDFQQDIAVNRLCHRRAAFNLTSKLSLQIARNYARKKEGLAKATPGRSVCGHLVSERVKSSSQCGDHSR